MSNKFNDPLDPDFEKVVERINNLEDALNQFIEIREFEIKIMMDRLEQEMNHIVTPYLETMVKCRLEKERYTYYTIIKKNIASIFNSKLRDQAQKGSSKFTLNEKKIINLIKQGKGTKEIAELLNMSPNSIKWYRGQIRRKLGLVSSTVTLIGYLSDHLNP